MTDKIKTVAELIEARRDDELEYIKAYIRQHGGDGLCCPGECGCGIDDLCPCGMEWDEMDCVPAKGEPGKFEGMKCTVYCSIAEADAPDNDVPILVNKRGAVTVYPENEAELTERIEGPLMPDTNPGLCLHVVSEPYQVPCNCEGGKIYHSDDYDIHRHIALQTHRGIVRSEPCPKCHGSGSRTVRLEGYVPVDEDGEYYGDKMYRCGDMAGHVQGLNGLIVEAWKDNTLPDAIRACLEERDCD